MKRDMDLIRQLLLDIEADKDWFETGEVEDDGTNVPEPEASERRLLGHHLRIMQNSGLIEVAAETTGGFFVSGLTWQGHDFLDTVRDPEVWKRTKVGVSKVGGAGFGLLKDMATAYAKHLAKERLGLEL